MLFTLRLAQIKLSEDPKCEELFEIFLKSSTVIEPQLLPNKLLDGRISKSQIGALEELTFTEHFANLATNL
jgi:hypothetical protein